MSDDAKCNPSSSSTPSPSTPAPAGWDESAGFRETMLHHFTQGEDAAALRHTAKLLHEMALEFARYWPKPEGYGIGSEMQAAAQDFRHLQGYLAMLGRERTTSALKAEESALSVLAERLAAETGRIAEEIERALEPAGAPPAPTAQEP